MAVRRTAGTTLSLVEVDADVLYIDDADVLTSAGSAAGLGLCIHLVRKDSGPTIANAVARRLVIAPHREGGQAQFIEAPVAGDSADDRVTQSMQRALANLAEPITVASLARHAHMSARTYLRHFARSTGSSPIRWLITQRVLHASLSRPTRPNYFGLSTTDDRLAVAAATPLDTPGQTTAILRS